MAWSSLWRNSGDNSDIMLIRCIRLKRIHIKLLFLLSVVLLVVIIISKLSPKDKSSLVQNKRLSKNFTHILELKLQEYENKIIPGLGDNGEPAFLDGADAKEGEKALKTYALNYVLSDRMPLDRKLRDPRNKK